MLSLIRSNYNLWLSGSKNKINLCEQKHRLHLIFGTAFAENFWPFDFPGLKFSKNLPWQSKRLRNRNRNYQNNWKIQNMPKMSKKLKMLKIDGLHRKLGPKIIKTFENWWCLLKISFNFDWKWTKFDRNFLEQFRKFQ